MTAPIIAENFKDMSGDVHKGSHFDQEVPDASPQCGGTLDKRAAANETGMETVGMVIPAMKSLVKFSFFSASCHSGIKFLIPRSHLI